MNDIIFHNVPVFHDRDFYEHGVSLIEVDHKLAKEIVKISGRISAQRGIREYSRRFRGDRVSFFLDGPVGASKMKDVRLHVDAESFWFSAHHQGLNFYSEKQPLSEVASHFGIDYSLAA